VKEDGWRVRDSGFIIRATVITATATSARAKEDGLADKRTDTAATSAATAAIGNQIKRLSSKIQKEQF
jgi:hypothetical protein